MSQTDYVMSLNLHLDPGALDAEPYRQFYLRHGLDAGTTAKVVTQGHGYLKMLTGLPPTFIRLIAGEKLRIGRREFSVSTGGGHAPEQLMFFCAAENLFLSADQVLAFISPNVSVWAVDPEGDPLAIYLRSLDSLLELPPDALVLPGHQLPFRGLHTRIGELKQHHAIRCAAMPRNPPPRSCRCCSGEFSIRIRWDLPSAKCWRTSIIWCGRAGLQAPMAPTA
jgi:glyoxylase-like metal-dependent hydrolase (beta-lactamase superfamily II)